MRGPMLVLAMLGVFSFGGLVALGPMKCGPQRENAASDVRREAPAVEKPRAEDELAAAPEMNMTEEKR